MRCWCLQPRCRLFAYDCVEWGVKHYSNSNCLHMVQLMPLHPKTPSFLPCLNTGWFYIIGTGLPRLSWKSWSNKTVQENTDKQTRYKSEKVNNLKYSKTKLPWFSCLLQHSARKRGGLILQCSRAHMEEAVKRAQQ